MKTAEVLKAFPEVTWHVCVTDMGMKGLWVGPVHVRRTSSGPWTWVLYQAGLAEIFVPYHAGAFRPYDLQWTTALDQVTSEDWGSNGTPIQLTNESKYTVVTEVRDRGVAWLCKQATMKTRRAEELLVWGVSDGGNYDNIVQYGFRDDGTMTFRLGNTGYNAPAFPGEAHTHSALWRVDMDLNGSGGDSGSWLEHYEPAPNGNSLQAQDYTTPFNGDSEGGTQWSALQFATLLVEDNAINAFGHKLGYEFTPVQRGTARHQEPWSNDDFYMTVFHPNELGWTTAWQPPDNYLLTHLNGESVTNTDSIVWVNTSVHHLPTDEDRSANDLTVLKNTGVSGITGATGMHWSGFDVEPHNLFDANPLGGPVKCGN